MVGSVVLGAICGGGLALGVLQHNETKKQREALRGVLRNEMLSEQFAGLIVEENVPNPDNQHQESRLMNLSEIQDEGQIHTFNTEMQNNTESIDSNFQRINNNSNNNKYVLDR